ncbi:two-component system sensor histidine kinase NtrB [Veronia pacifica]|uniref:Sensory histidine kinase/phosphatase NtrB n=1 Tax=Veronia pacifica TaxID=1080227 RepID=A0A1C3EJN3_9GAMM|nr:two-component system sensor histidine kinase NtrB [Veronia pacifica]
MATMTETILDNLITAVMVLDSSLTAVYANPAAEQLFCQSARRLKEKPLPQLLQHCSADLSLIRDTLTNGQGLTDSDVTIVIDGEQRKVELSASPLSWQTQQAILLEIKPIGQQQRISQEISQHAQQQAAKELVRGLAHEIKNPLGGLRGAAQLMEKMVPDPAINEYTGIIIEQADRLRNLVDRLLGPQKPGAQKEQNIHVVLEKVRQLVQLDKSDNVEIKRDYDPSLPEILIDEDQLVQAILNVVNNACQILADKGGEILLRTRTEHQVLLHGKRHRLVAKIEIIDNGPGVKPSLIDTLFYPMVTGRAGGTGLGLSITRNLIDQHSGKIDVISWPGNTAFTIFLPIRR